jgi:PAS domain S-box-containing protein
MSQVELLEEIESLRRRVAELEDIQARLTKSGQDLRDSEAQFRAFSEHTFEAILLSEMGACIGQNFAAEKMFGYSTEEAAGRSETEWIAPDYRELVTKNKCLDCGPSCEVMALRKDGTTFPCEIQRKTVDHQGRLIRVTALRDITERRKAEEALRESEEKYRLIFSKEQDAIVLTDAETNKFLDVNESAERLWGYTREELLDMNALDMSAEPQESRRSLAAGAGPGGAHVPVRWHRKKDGTIFPVEISAGSFDWHGLKVVCSIIRDISFRVRTEAALRESEEKYRRLHETMMDAFVRVDMQGRIQETNQAYQAMLGYSEEELRSLTCVDLTPEKWHALEAGIVEDQVLVKGYSDVYQKEYRRKDGAILSVELRRFLIRDRAGRPSEMWAIVRDISGRKRAEEAIQLANRDWERTFNSISDLIMVLDGEHKILRANKAMTASLGMTEHEMVGKTCFDLVHGEMEPPAFCPHSQLLLDGKEHSVELAEPRLGRICDVRVSPLIDPKGQVVGSVHVSRDITERKRAEEALRQLEMEKSLILGSTAEMFTYCDLDLRVRWTNKAFASSVGHKPEDLVGRHCYEIRRGRQAPCENCPVTLARETGLPQQAETSTPDGRIWFLRGYPAKDERGKTVGLIELMQDITERKEAEDALRESEERFRAIFEGATDSIWVKDRSLRYTHVNRAMCKLMGLPPSKIIGWQASDLFGEETGRQLRALEARVLSGESVDLERTREVRGQMMTFHDTLVPLRSQAGDIIGICGICRNITERKRATEVTPISDQAYSAPSMQVVLNQARLAASCDAIVLLQGESGSGKDFLARWMHEHSKQSNGPFFSINCAAVSKELAESELFGHERGSFTGALGIKKGLLELAEGGTILLNEIGELPLSLQAKLLMFLDTRSFMRVGGQRHIKVNARLIAATHRDLRREVEEKRFLDPLFYRLNVLPIHIPPLRDRAEDLPVLVNEIMSKLASELQLPAMPVIDPGVIDALSEYEWPGNVRELRNVLEHSLMLWHGGPFMLQMPRAQRSASEQIYDQKDARDWSYVVRYSPDKGLEGIVEEVETSLYEHVLEMARGKKNEAAKLLKISRGSLYRYIRKWEGKHRA